MLSHRSHGALFLCVIFWVMGCDPSLPDRVTGPPLPVTEAFAVASANGTVSIASNFNATPISAGATVWFSAVFRVSGRPPAGTTIYFSKSTIQFAANGSSLSLPVPAGAITYSATAAHASSSFDSLFQTWRTIVPSSYSGDVFLTGFAYQVPAALPGGIHPVTWSGSFTSSTAGLSVHWKWAAAVYTRFAADNNAIGAKPVDGHRESAYRNADHAGTPERFKRYVTGGARGGGGSNWTGGHTGTGRAEARVAFGHVFIVTEENTDYADVIGSPAMPYLNSLAQQYGLATQYYANTHPSIGNYFMMNVGKVITNDDDYSSIVTDDNVVRELLKAGRTWKSYAEDLPDVGYTGGDVGNYARKHNTFALLSDVVNDPTQVRRLVPFTQFATDLANGTLPNYSNIVPNLCNDGHDCSLRTADDWLRANIDPLVKSATFQLDGVLIILFDESGDDDRNGGGRVAWVVVSPKAKRGYQSTRLYQHGSTLRLSLKQLGVTVFPNAAASAPDMDEFFIP